MQSLKKVTVAEMYQAIYRAIADESNPKVSINLLCETSRISDAWYASAYNGACKMLTRPPTPTINETIKQYVDRCMVHKYGQ